MVHNPGQVQNLERTIVFSWNYKLLLRLCFFYIVLDMHGCIQEDIITWSLFCRLICFKNNSEFIFFLFSLDQVGGYEGLVEK